MRTPFLLTVVLAACSPTSMAPQLPLVGEAREFTDPARAVPPFCQPGVNCTIFSTPCATAIPDGVGGVWCHAVNLTNSDQRDLVHASADGGELSRELLGNRVYPRIAAGPGGAAALVVPLPSHLVGVQTDTGQRWRHLFDAQVVFADVTWLPNGHVLAVGTCEGSRTTPVALDCSTSPGTALFEFTADGTSVVRTPLPGVTNAVRVLTGPENALYVATSEGSVGAAKLHRVDPGHTWAFGFGNGSLPGDAEAIRVMPNGRIWLTINFQAMGSLTIGDRTVGQSGLAGACALAILDPAGTLVSLQGSISSFTGAEGLVGFGALPNGEVVACWNLENLGPSVQPSGKVGENTLPGSSIVQFLPNGTWRGIRGGACQGLTSDAAGRLYFLYPYLREQPQAKTQLVRIDPVGD